MDFYLGKMLDNRYEILERIGTGGMAVVYKAKCHRLNRLVAIKILKSDLAQDANFRRRFNTESQAVALLSHANIVSVYDVSKGGDVEYIVMELIDGITLKQYMEKRGSLSWRESLHFITQIMRGLAHAHSRGIVHRDIKPQNIMVLRDGSVKVTDFGIACMTDTAQTLTQQAFGSVHYISPEQAKGDGPDTRSDIYSAGIMFYEMLCNRLPFEGDTAVGIALQHLSSIPLSPRDLNPEVPEQLELICLKAMATTLEKRYHSAEAMIEDLEDFRKNPNVVLDFEKSDIQPHETSDPTQKINTTMLHGQTGKGRKPERIQEEVEEDRDRSGIYRIVALLALLGVIVVGLVFLFRSIFDSFITPVPEYSVPDLEGYTLEEAMALDEIDGIFEIVLQKEAESDTFAFGEIMAQSPSADSTKKSDFVIYVTVSLGTSVEEMPDVRDLESRVASLTLKSLIEELDLTVDTVQVYSDSVTMGYVVDTLPVAGDALQEGDVITFYVSQGPQIPTTSVPLFVGRDFETVSAELESVWKLTLGSNTTYVESDQPAGEILEQSILTSTEVDEQTSIDFVVSAGKSEPVTNTITINCELPQDRDQVHLLVTLNGIPQYDRTVETSEEVVRVSLTGSTSGLVTIYWDGLVYQEYTQQFD